MFHGFSAQETIVSPGTRCDIMLPIETTMGQAVQPALAIEVAPTEAAHSIWSLPKRIGFRCLCSYFILYNLPMMGHVNLLDAIPGVPWLSKRYMAFGHAIVPWVAIHRSEERRVGKEC